MAINMARTMPMELKFFCQNKSFNNPKGKRFTAIVFYQ